MHSSEPDAFRHRRRRLDSRRRRCPRSRTAHRDACRRTSRAHRTSATEKRIRASDRGRQRRRRCHRWFVLLCTDTQVPSNDGGLQLVVLRGRPARVWMRFGARVAHLPSVTALDLRIRRAFKGVGSDSFMMAPREWIHVVFHHVPYRPGREWNVSRRE